MDPQPNLILDQLRGKISPALWKQLSAASSNTKTIPQSPEAGEERDSGQGDVCDTKPPVVITTSSSPDDSTALSVVSGEDSSQSGSLKRKRHGSSGIPKRVKAMSARGLKVYQPSGPLRLRVDHPVQADRPSDIWKMILGNCHPRFLRTAWKFNKETYYILKVHSSIWKQARLEHYGYDMPAVPPELDEWKLSTLMEGKKCSICKAQRARTVFWSIQARVCNKCFHEKVMLIQFGNFDRFYALMGDEPWAKRWAQQLVYVAMEAVPFAAFRTGSYRASSTSWNTGYLADVIAANGSRRSGFKRYYGIDNLKKFKTDFLTFLGPHIDNPDNLTQDEFRAWSNTVQDAAPEKFKPYADLERFFSQRKQTEIVSRRKNKAARIIFFRKRAAEMDPPMTNQDLFSCPAFHRFIDIPNPPSELSWLQLKKKMIEEADNPALQSGSKTKVVALARANQYKSMAEGDPYEDLRRSGPYLGSFDGAYDFDVDDTCFDEDRENSQHLVGNDGDGHFTYGYYGSDEPYF